MNKAIEVAVALTAYDKMSQVVNSVVANATTKMGKLNHMAEHMKEWGEKSMIRGEAITEFFDKTIEEAEKVEVSTKRLKQVFKSMGEHNNEAAETSERYAAKLSYQIGVEQQVIEGVQAKIATFKSISNESARASGMFDKVTRAAFDMAKTGFGEASTNAAQLGKALEDPIKGTMGLRRMGIIFTKEQKEQVKILVETGQKLKAQKIIMDAVEHKVGGVAKATVTTSERMKIAWKQVQIQIGTQLLPLWDEFLGKVMEYLPVAIKFVKENQGIIKVVAMIGVGLVVLGGAFRIVGGAIQTVTALVKNLGIVMDFLAANPIVLIIAAVVALAIAAYQVYKHWDAIKKWFADLWEKVKASFVRFGTWVYNWPINKPVRLIVENWGKIKTFFKNIWPNIKQYFVDFTNWLFGLPARMYEAGKNIVKSIWEGMKSFVMKPINMIKDMVKKIRDFLPFSPAKTGPLRDIHRIRLIETIAENMKPHAMVNAMRKTAAATMAVTMPVTGMAGGGNNVNSLANNSSSHSISVHYAPVIHMAGGANATDSGDFAKLLKKHEREISRIVEEQTRKNSRTSYK